MEDGNNMELKIEWRLLMIKARRINDEKRSKKKKIDMEKKRTVEQNFLT